MIQHYGWQARVHEGTDDWSADSARLIFFRRLPEGGGEQIIGFDEGGFPVVEPVAPGTVMRAGLRLPREAIDALAEFVKPGPSQGEMKRLEEALAIERRRVDEMTRAMVDACSDAVRHVELAMAPEPSDGTVSP